MFPITLIKGSKGSITITNNNGAVSLNIQGQDSLGGGEAAGVVAPVLMASFPLDLPQATHLLALFAEKEIPVAAAAIAAGDAMAEAAEKTL